MNEVKIDDLPPGIRKYFFNKQIEIMLETIEKAGLLLEFKSFLDSKEALNVSSFGELCTLFGNKYPEKFYTVSLEERYNKIFLCKI